MSVFRLLLTGLLAGSSCLGTPPLVERVFEKYKHGLQGWAYTQITTLPDEVLVERFDPRRDPALQWDLLLVDGEPPPDQRLHEYRESKEKAIQRYLEKPEQERIKAVEFLRHLIEDANYTRVTESAHSVTYKLDLPEVERDTKGFRQWLYREICEELVGELILDKEREDLISLRIWNTGKISPMFSVAFEEVNIELTMAWHPQYEAVLPLVSRDVLKGHVFFFGQLDREAVVTFRDFTRVPLQESRDVVRAQAAPGD